MPDSTSVVIPIKINADPMSLNSSMIFSICALFYLFLMYIYVDTHSSKNVQPIYNSRFSLR
jgi:hypothetical protein